jgi:hypothetical protein
MYFVRGISARLVTSSLRRENVQSSGQVLAPALPNENVSASYGREVVRISRQVLAPAITLASLAGRLASARLNVLPTSLYQWLIILAEIYNMLSSDHKGF